MIDTNGIITAPSEEEYQTLRDSIRTHGQHRPILRAPDGSIIDGNQRLRACRELGIDPETTEIPEARSRELIEGFVLLHNAASGRKPIPAERDRIVLALHKRGMTMREIVEATGVSYGTVNKITRSATPCDQVDHTGMGTPERSSMRRRVDKAGRSQPIRKTTPTEVARRDALITNLYQRGHSTREIATALSVGVSLVVGRLPALGVKGSKRYKGAGAIIEPCPWRDEDVPRTEASPRWRQSRVIDMAKMLNDEYTEGNFAALLANHVTEALDADDRSWHRDALDTISAALEKLERARRVLTDDAYRVECRDTHEGSEQLRRPRSQLRAVR